MLIFDFKSIGNKLLARRKQAGMTQGELAEAAGLSDRTYADIERGTVNARIETILNICKSLDITPDDILTEMTDNLNKKQEEILEKLNRCTPSQRETAINLLEVYLNLLK